MRISGLKEFENKSSTDKMVRPGTSLSRSVRRRSIKFDQSARRALQTTALVPFLTLPNPALAGCDTSNSVTTCTKDPFPYSKSVDGGSSDSRVFYFQDLNATPKNDSDSAVIYIYSTGSHGSDTGDDGEQGRPLDVYYDGNGYTMKSTKTSIQVTSWGGSGHDGKDRDGTSGISGGEGGAGGAGGGLYFEWKQGDIVASGAMQFDSRGGDGGEGGKGKATLGNANGDDGGDGGAGGVISLGFGIGSAIDYTGGPIRGWSLGGDGGKGGPAVAEAGRASGKHGGQGGDGSTVVATFYNDFSITQTTDEYVFGGLNFQSRGGDGGHGGSAGGDSSSSSAGDGGHGGDGGTINVDSQGGELTFDLRYASASAIYAASTGGAGGKGGNADSSVGDAKGGDGGNGGSGGSVTIDLSIGSAGLNTTQYQAQGIFAQSLGGAGGDGGDGSGGLGSGTGGGGALAGDGGSVKINLTGGPITTLGDESNAIVAQSIGGFAGDGGDGTGFVAYGADSESGGSGSSVTVTLGTGFLISTEGDDASAIIAQSIGGGGGRGGSGSGLTAMGGVGSSGGSGGNVTVTTKSGSTLSTLGNSSFAIEAQSIGGAGGSAGASKGLISMGGSAGAGGNGGKVTINNVADLSTGGDYADAIVAQSIGGGGGNAHSTSGMLSVGGSGGDGGSGGNVTVNNAASSIKTTGADADAVFIQSIGGGGGSGSNAFAAGAQFSTAIGGQGGSGGSAGNVSYIETNSGSISTEGDHSKGVMVQSIGGGGGDGGYGISASAGYAFDLSLGAGGSGSHGGSGGQVYAQVMSQIQTEGDHSAAIQAQSIGGGGGNGGMAISSANTNGIAASTAVGGSGGIGGDGGIVQVLAEQTILTLGDSSTGVMAQSVGGGGGSSGLTIDANAVSNMSAAVAIGRGGGSGGNAGDVYVTTIGSVKTEGASSDAILAQSIGGSGGNASAVIAASGKSETGSLNVAIGGAGGSGGDAGSVYVHAYEDIVTYGTGSLGIVAQSIGGSGGNGSLTVAGSLSSNDAIDVGIGGSGGGGGLASEVEVTADALVYTQGDNSIGILAQSIGGSGGNGGMSIAAAAMAGNTANVSVSGSGGTGNASGDVTVNSNYFVITDGMHATGIKAMSIGGGGGNASAALTGSTSQMGQAGVTLGGGGGGGGTAGDVAVNLDTGGVHTYGDYADAIWAGSLGGGGGHGAIAVQGSMSAGEYSSTNNVTIGGLGGSGGTAGDVSIISADYASGLIQTAGYQSRGIFASSIGGSGGSGGSAYSGSLVFTENVGMTVGVSVGGSGGDGGAGGAVTVDNQYRIITTGHYADGILAQSIGGDGGVGGNSVTMAGQASESSSLNFATAVGGNGGTGAHAGVVSVTNSAALAMTGMESHGIYAQSVGGGGGRGGNAGTVLMDATASQQDTSEKNITMNVGIQVGGTGGAGGNAKAVTVSNSGSITTGYQSYDDGELVESHTAYGIFAQSVGGGGGDGGSVSGFVFSVSGSCTASGLKNYYYQCENTDGVKSNYAPTLQLAMGGDGASAGNGSSVSVTNSASITTSGTESHAIFAQSVGGGGGNGGYGDLGSVEAIAPSGIVDDVASFAKLATMEYSNTKQFQTANIIIGGQGGAAGDAGTVTVKNYGDITTNGEAADAINAQSVGGGGGSGGTAYSGLGQWGQAAVGGAGSGGGNGGDISVDTSGLITTNMNDAMGIFAQSVGGGGGRAGAVTRSLNGILGADLNIGKGVGLSLEAGDGGNGGDVSINLAQGGGIYTYGDYAHGIFAQSIGGGGGSANIQGVENQLLSFAGGTGDDGNGGDIDVTLNSPVIVSGEGAHAVFAQSTSGDVDGGPLGVNSGDVTVNVNSTIAATGTDGRGLLLQSDGYSEKGKISVTISESGSVTTGVDGSDTIALAHGKNNVIKNYGTIEKQENKSSTSFALNTYAGALTMKNYGLFLGSVQLAALTDDLAPTSITNTFSNELGGYLGMGYTFDLGDTSSSLTNNGTMASGTFGSNDTTSFTGQLNQTSLGTLWVDFNFEGENDLITVDDDGSATLAGAVEGNPIETVPSDAATGSFTILKAPTGLTIDGLEAIDTAIVDYTVSKEEGTSTDSLVLAYDIDYSGQTTTAAAPLTQENSENYYKVADYISKLASLRRKEYANGGSEFAFVEDFILPLLKVSTLNDLADVYWHLTPADLHRMAEAHIRSSLLFAGNLMSCPKLSGATLYAFRYEGNCAWSQISFTSKSVEGHNNSLNYDEESWQFSTGVQYEFEDDWFIGGGFSYEQANAETSISSNFIQRFNLGGVIKHEIADTTYAASLSFGHSEDEITRTALPNFNAVVESFNTSQSWLAAHGRISHLFKLNDGNYIEPYADAGVRWRPGQSHTFGGALPIDLEVQSGDLTQYSAKLGVSLGQSITMENLKVDMGVDLGVQSIFGGDYTSMVKFADDPQTSLSLSSSSENLIYELGAHAAVQVGELSSVRVKLNGQFGENEKGFGANFRFSHQF